MLISQLLYYIFFLFHTITLAFVILNMAVVRRAI